MRLDRDTSPHRARCGNGSPSAYRRTDRRHQEGFASMMVNDIPGLKEKLRDCILPIAELGFFAQQRQNDSEMCEQINAACVRFVADLHEATNGFISLVKPRL